MEAIRQIVTVKNNEINITLPDNFSANEVEVIILPTAKKENAIANLKEKKVKQTTEKSLKNASISPNFMEVMKEMEHKS